VLVAIATTAVVVVGLRITAVVAEPELDAVATRLNPEGNDIYNTAFHNLSFSPDGKWLAIGQGTGEVLILDSTLWQTHATVKAHDNWAFSVIFSPSSDQLFTAGGDNLIKIWDLDSLKQPIKTLREHGMDIHGLALTPDGSKLISAGDDQVPVIWDLAGNTIERRLLEHPKQVTSVAISPDGQYVVTSSRDTKVRIFSFDTGEMEYELSGHKADVMSVRFSPDSELVASASYDGSICIWDTDMGYLVERREMHDGAAVCVDFSPDGKQLVSVDHQQLHILQTDDLKADVETLKPELQEAEQMSFVRFSPDGKHIAVTTTNARVLIIDATTRTVLGSVGELAAKAKSPSNPKSADESESPKKKK